MSAFILGFAVVINGRTDYIPLAPQVIVTTDDPDEAWVRAIVGSVDDRVFDSRDLKRHSQQVEALRILIGDMDAARIGMILQKLEGRNFDGYVLERVKRVKKGWLWHIRCN